MLPGIRLPSAFGAELRWRNQILPSGPAVMAPGELGVLIWYSVIVMSGPLTYFAAGPGGAPPAPDPPVPVVPPPVVVVAVVAPPAPVALVLLVALVVLAPPAPLVAVLDDPPAPLVVATSPVVADVVLLAEVTLVVAAPRRPRRITRRGASPGDEQPTHAVPARTQIAVENCSLTRATPEASSLAHRHCRTS